MARRRIDPHIWHDLRFADLPWGAKLITLHILTTDTRRGVYVPTIAAATGLDAPSVESVLNACLTCVEKVTGKRPAVLDAPPRQPADRTRGDRWMRLRRLIFERDNYTCQYCGARGVRLECDHVHPVSRGGLDHPSNLVTACFSCNRSKRDKLIGEWVR
jgi:hypothetical protein